MTRKLDKQTFTAKDKKMTSRWVEEAERTSHQKKLSPGMVIHNQEGSLKNTELSPEVRVYAHQTT